MCRLSGYYIPCKNQTRNLEAKINLVNLVVSQEMGGYDATGLSFVTKPDKFFVLKEPIPAGKFMAGAAVAETLEKNSPRCMIAHCRAQTLGDKTNNQNNHPHYTKSGIITIHNGMITNHAELFTKYKLHRDAEVDSEIVGKLIEFYRPVCADTTEAIQQSVKEIRGSLALAILNAHEPDTLYLVRRENNLSMALDRDTGIIYFATEAEALAAVLIKRKTFMGFFTKIINPEKIIIQEIPIGYGVKITKNKITMFEVEAPPVEAWGAHYYGGANGIIIAAHKSKQDKIEAWDEPIRAGFKFTDPIKKPSRFTTEELQSRREWLAKLEIKKPLPQAQDVEIKRLEQTILAREKLSKQPTLLS